MSKEYWKIVLEEILCDYPIVVTESLVNKIISAKEMENESCGYDKIPNPLVTEITSLIKRIRDLEVNHLNALGSICANYAKVNKLSIDDVIIQDNKLMVRRPKIY